MSKAMITKLFVGSAVALVGGIVLLAVGTMALADDVFVLNGPDVVGIRSGPFPWTLAGLAVLTGLIVIAAVITQFIVWILAVVNAAGLPDKTWLVVLLVTGLLGFGFVGMVVYVVAAPDSLPPGPQMSAPRMHTPAGPEPARPATR